MDIQEAKTRGDLKLCGCGCGNWMPRINKLGKEATFIHGHNVKKGFYDFNNPDRLTKIGDAHRGKPRPDMLNNTYRMGLKPANAIKKDQHISPATEYKPGHLGTPEQRTATSERTKNLWKDPAYRKKFIDGPRKKKYDTAPEMEIRSFLDVLHTPYIPNRTVRYAPGLGRKNTTQPDVYIPKKKLAIYYDEPIWHSNPEKKKKDAHARNMLKKMGYNVIVFTPKEVKELTLTSVQTLLDSFPNVFPYN